MNTIISYLHSKTVQAIVLLVVLGLLKAYNAWPFDEQIWNTLIIVAFGWLGIGIRGAMPKEIGK